ncbi:MAG: hypothetical protein ACREL4_03895, partial [Gemmatimonadales bacterium]
LTLAARLGSSGSRPWADAMLAELDAVEGDWSSLWWAMGGAGALLRRSIREMRISRRALLFAGATAALLTLGLRHRTIRETRPVAYPYAAAAPFRPPLIQPVSR